MATWGGLDVGDHACRDATNALGCVSSTYKGKERVGSKIG